MAADHAPGKRSPGSYFRFALATLPWVGLLGLTPFANRVEPFVLGLPFLLFWIVLWVVITSVCLAIVYRTDPVNRNGGKR